MIQKYCVNRLARWVVTPEAKRYVRNTARNFGVRQVLANPSRRFNKINRVVVVLLDTRCNSENIGIENNIFWWVAHLINQYPVSSRTNFSFALKGIGLAFFIKGHDDNSSAITFA